MNYFLKRYSQNLLSLEDVKQIDKQNTKNEENTEIILGNSDIKQIESIQKENKIERPTIYETREARALRIKKEKETEQAIKHAHLQKAREEKYKLIDKEAEQLANLILSAAKDRSEEELSNLVVLLLNNEEKLKSIAQIYRTDAIKKNKKLLDSKIVVREALNKVLRTAKTRIEIKHAEFPRVEPVKRMKF